MTAVIGKTVRHVGIFFFNIAPRLYIILYKMILYINYWKMYYTFSLKNPILVHLSHHLDNNSSTHLTLEGRLI